MMFKPFMITKLKENSYLQDKRIKFPKFGNDKYLPLRLKDFSKLWSGSKLKLVYFDFVENKWKNFIFEYEVIEKKNLKEKRIIGKSNIWKNFPEDYKCLYVYNNSNLVFYSLKGDGKLDFRFSPVFRKVV